MLNLFVNKNEKLYMAFLFWFVYRKIVARFSEVPFSKKLILNVSVNCRSSRIDNDQKLDECKLVTC